MSVESIVKLKESEKVVGVIRQFPLPYVNHLLISTILFAAPFFFMVPLFGLGKIGLAAFGLSAFVGAFLAFRTLIRWYWTVFIVTNRRVIDCDQRGFFDRFVSEAVYEKVQDISYSRKGVWGTLLNYGTLVIQTAGATAHLEQYFVRRPQDIQHMIVETMTSYLAGPPGERNDKVAGLLSAAAELSGSEIQAYLAEIKGEAGRARNERVMAGASQAEVNALMGGEDGEEDIQFRRMKQMEAAGVDVDELERRVVAGHFDRPGEEGRPPKPIEDLAADADYFDSLEEDEDDEEEEELI